MTITRERFRRLETILLAHFDPGVAELIGTLIAAAIEANPSSNPSARVLIGAESIDLDWLSITAERTRDETFAWVRETDRAMRDILGFPLCDVRALRIKAPLTRGMTLELSRCFRDLIEGRGLRALGQVDADALMPDNETAKWLGLIRDAAASGAAGKFLYSLASPPDSEDARRELRRVGWALKDLAEPAPILVSTGYRDHTALRLPATGLALSAILHADANTMLIVPPGSLFKTKDGPPDNAHEHDDDEFDGPVSKPVAASGLTEAGMRFTGLLPALDITILIAMPDATVLPASTRALFAGIVGPFRADKPSAVAALKASSPQHGLDTSGAETLLDAVGDPAHARELLRVADCLARHDISAGKPRPAQTGDGPIEWIPSRAAQGHEDTADRSSPADPHALVFNARVTQLAASLSRGSPSGWAIFRPTRIENFDPDLFVADPDPGFLFARAQSLRAAGARILVAGPAGSGKTVLASELARRMGGMTVTEHRAASLFFRGWGSAERAIQRAFDAAIKDNHMLFFDEADSLMGSRDKNDGSSHLRVAATSAFLTALSSHPLPVMASTNFLSEIDAAIRRRFDVVLTTRSLPEDREVLAWTRLLVLKPPDDWRPIGNTVAADYSNAARQMRLIGETNAEAAAACIRRARDIRIADGSSQNGGRMGFV